MNPWQRKFCVFFCILNSKLEWKGKENWRDRESLPWTSAKTSPNPQGSRVTKPLSGEAAAAQGLTEKPRSLFKNKTQTRSYMNTYLLQVALWKAKSDKYKHYTELQASLPKPQTRCVLQRKQQNNIYNGRQSQINQPNFKTDLWSRNSKYNEQFQPYMF